ncbi:MAG: hypothetical protein EOP83_16685 [Verrucomicrobiaceae bacterium]|nr:MAG: hypothetical protein EOP83_16685 [Verrucomicrobiaceae bacterium]
MSRKPFLLLALLASANAQNVTHRWTFNTTGGQANGTVITDVITSAPATIVGAGAVRNGSVVTLPGTSNGNVAAATISAYLDLPNGIVSSKTNLTVELWATPVSAKNWQRLIDFGNMNTAGTGEISNTAGAPAAGTSSRDNLMIAECRGTTLNDKKLVGRNDGSAELGAENTLSTTPGTEYHYVLTFQAGVGANPTTGGRLSWYRNGTFVSSVDTNFRLSDITDVNNWLGRSQYTNDSNSNITYNEVRLYDYALSPAQISANTTAGANASFPAPAVDADSVTMLHGRKAKLNVLANDSGEIVRSSLIVQSPPSFGTATVSPDGAILYTHSTGTPTNDSFTYRISNSTGQTSTATVAVAFSSSLKIANPSLNVPSSPPATAYSLPNALGTLTFSQPLCLVTPPGETKRLFVCEKGGVVLMVPDVTATSPTASPFFDLQSEVTGRTNENFLSDGESGLLSIAFHPNSLSASESFYHADRRSKCRRHRVRADSHRAARRLQQSQRRGHALRHGRLSLHLRRGRREWQRRPHLQ